MAVDTKKVSRAKIIQVLSEILDFKTNENNDSSSNPNSSTMKVSIQPENVTQPMCPMSRVMNLASHCTRSQRWTAGAKFFPAIARHISINPLSVWKIGAASLAYHENSNRAEMSKFANAMIQAGRFVSPEVLLDHVIYLMCNGKYEEASRFIDDNKKKCPKSYSETLWATLQGTRGLLRYINWRENIQRSENPIEEECIGDAIVHATEIVNGAEKSIDCFKNSLCCSNNFDVFIVKLIEVLEFYERLEEADQALASYIQLNYRQPTPYILMLNFIQKHYPDDIQRQIYILKELVKTCPSDSHVLQLAKLLTTEEKQYKMHLLFNFVDFDEWRNEVEVWKCLTEVVLSEPKSSLNLILRKHIDERASWWSLYHFIINELDFSDFKLRELAIHKAVLATIMFNSAHTFVKAVSTKLSEVGDMDNLKKLNDFLVVARQVGEAIKISLLEVEMPPSSSVSNVYFTSDKTSLPVLSKLKTTLSRNNAKKVSIKPNILRTYERSSVSPRLPPVTGNPFLQALLKNPVPSPPKNSNLAITRLPQLPESNSPPEQYVPLNALNSGVQQLTSNGPSVPAKPVFFNHWTAGNPEPNSDGWQLQNLLQQTSKCSSFKITKFKYLDKKSKKDKNTLSVTGKQTQKRKMNSTLPMSNKKPVNGSQMNLNTSTSDKTIVKIENSKTSPASVYDSGNLIDAMKIAKVALKRLTEREIEKYCKLSIKKEINDEVITID